MDYLINVNETNFNQILNAMAQMPVVFHFTSPQNAHAVELGVLLTQIANEHQGQFLLATVNCDEQPMIAAQFRIATIPTIYLFLDGQPVDVITGSITEQDLRIRLANILPREEELKFHEALALLENQRYSEALPLLKSAWELTDKKNSEFALLYAETYLAMKHPEPAKSILATIPIQDRDSRWHGLQAQIELLEQAANSPEIQQLQQDYAQSPTAEIAIKLAGQLNQSGRNEEALSLLFDWLKKDLNIASGEIKNQFLAILAAIGNHDPVVVKYRRRLYSLLY